MTKDIDNYHPFSGRFVKEDGTTVNIADALNGKSMSNKVYDIGNMMPHSGRFIKEDGTTVNIADMIANGDIGGGTGGGGGSSDDSAPPIIETYSGQVIQCFMSADRPLKGLNLYATCKQQSYSGKNLFNKDTIEDGIVNASGQLDSSELVKTSDFIKVKPSTQYKSSFNFAHVKFYTSEKQPVQTENVEITANTQSFTTGESTEYIRYSFNFSAQTPETLIIVEGTNELTPYEPYTGGIPSPNVDYPQEIETISNFTVEVKNSMEEGTTPQTLNITIPGQGFYGIRVSSGSNYTDSSSRRWICDEFDFKNKKFIKRIRRITFDGSEDEPWIKSTAQENYQRFFVNLSNGRNTTTPCLCNRLIYGTMGKSGSCFVSGSIFYAYLEPSINSVELLREYLNTHPLDVIYPLETPTEYDFTDAEIEQYKKPKSYYDTTYIDNDAVPACNMQAELVLDTKLYIDNKFATLAGQILEMGV